MPTYDYRCDANGRVVEAIHGMRESLATWGELCRRAGIQPGDTPVETPVTRLIRPAAVIGRAPVRAATACSPATCCGGTCARG